MTTRRFPSDLVAKQASVKRKKIDTSVQSIPSTIEKKVPPPTDADDVYVGIAARAYALYEARGYQHGRDIQDWLEAEQSLLEEQKVQP